MQPRWTETTKRMVVVLGVLLGLGLLYLARVTLGSLLIAAVVAYIVHPLIEFLHRRLRLPHALSTVLVYLLLLAFLAAIPIFLVPLLIRQVQALNLNFLTLFSQGRDWLSTTLASWRTISIAGTAVDLSPLVDPALSALGEKGALPPIPPPEVWLPRLFGTLSGFALTLTSATLGFILTILYSFYLAKDSHFWQARLEQALPEAYRPEISTLMRRLGRVWGAFLRGQLLLCLIVALVTYIVLAALGIPGSIPLALLTGVLQVIPNIGSILALVPIVVVTLVQGSMTIALAPGWVALLVTGVYVLLQFLIYNFLSPLIIGESIGLPALVVLVGVVIGTAHAGLLGAFLSVPVLASLRVLASYAYNKVLERPPFPEEEKRPASPPPEKQPQGPSDA